jgi:integrase/recombinase XerD
MSGISHFLRAALGSWPRPGAPQSATEAIARSLLTEYRSELTKHTDLAPSTVVGMLEEGERFLEWCQERGVLFNGADLSIADVDAFVERRAARLRRTTCKTMVKRLQRFLRFLHTIRRIPVDLSTRLVAPTLYHYESLPSILDPGQMASVLECTRKDRSPKGRRDYAILMLVATYGLRAGEVVRLRLDDID